MVESNSNLLLKSFDALIRFVKFTFIDMWVKLVLLMLEFAKHIFVRAARIERKEKKTSK